MPLQPTNYKMDHLIYFPFVKNSDLRKSCSHRPRETRILHHSNTVDSDANFASFSPEKNQSIKNISSADFSPMSLIFVSKKNKKKNLRSGLAFNQGLKNSK